MQQHDRKRAHKGTDLDTNVVLDGSTAAYSDGAGLHAVLVDLDSRTGALEAGGGGAVASYATELDDAGDGVTYVGEATPGTATSTDAWRIKRITETGPDVSVQWADGDAFFDNIWDDRLTLSYT
jgi:hypothetical protein